MDYRTEPQLPHGKCFIYPTFFTNFWAHFSRNSPDAVCDVCQVRFVPHELTFGGKTRDHARTINPIRLIPLMSFQDKRSKPKEMDHFFLLIMSIIIFFMQCGFAFMEAGAVR